MRTKSIFVVISILINLAHAKNYYVSTNGSDLNDGSINFPFRNIQTASDHAYPGDVITVHKGVYRERIDPPRGGSSDDKRIVYRAAPGEKVVIKGSEIAKEWEVYEDNIWCLKLSNNYFGSFNPFANEIRSDWFFPLDQEHTTGAVYINNVLIAEAASMDDLFGKVYGMRWYAKSDNTGTQIWVNFLDKNPNNELVEINKRRTVFYPSKTGINYITVKGFNLTHAANPWSPPTREQIGLIGVNWSKGWTIENNVISHARCAGITLGKYHDRLDGLIKFGYNAHYQTVKRVIARGDWTKENIGHHVVRNNHIYNCEQAGIVGSHGGSFSLIEGNQINNINIRGWWDGFEQAGIKLHAGVDTIIRDNFIHHCQRGIWLDWMSQGARVSGNFLFDNEKHDFFTEVNHGPLLVDNNFFLSQVSIRDASQGGAYVHNFLAGKIQSRSKMGSDRFTQYFKPHSCIYVGETNIKDGDERFYNNLFLSEDSLSEYKAQKDSTNIIEGNVFLHESKSGLLSGLLSSSNDNSINWNIIREESDYHFSFKFDYNWSSITREQISTKKLGLAEVTKQKFDNPNGKEIILDSDYFGNPREKNPFPGPYEIYKSEDRIKIWPKK